MKFIIKGKPQGKARPRFRRIGNFVSTYTTKQTQDYENLVKNSLLEQNNDKIRANYQGRVNVSIWAYFKPNKSISKKKYLELLGTEYTKKPDCDNISKIILDSLNGIAYKDDSQIYKLNVEKLYSDDEYVEVEINYLD